MANDFNHITVTGRLGGDPEMRYTTNGTAITSFSLANGQYDAQAENNELTTWYRVSIFGKRAEAANQYLVKGARVLISGAHRIRKYTSKDGEERESNEIVADNFTFLDSKRDEGGQAAERPTPRKAGTPAPARNAPRQVDPSSEDLPF